MPNFGQGAVLNPGTSNSPDGGTPISIGFGRQNDEYYSEVHGRWYTAAYRNKLFRGSSAATGLTIPVSTATAATFTLYNPIGSGVNVELVRYASSVQNATHVVSSVLLGIVTGLLLAPTSVTPLTTGPALFGGSGIPAAQLYSIATLAAQATVFYNVGAYGSTAATYMDGIDHQFDGMLLMAPGSLVHVVGTAAQSQASTQTFVWAEWPA